MSRRTVHCSRCGKEFWHFGTEQADYFCETVRCESTEPQTEKRPGSVAKQESRTAETNYQEEAAAVNESTRTHSLGHQGGVQMSPTGERGVVHLGMVHSTGDAVIFSLTTDQARDLADSIFIGADQIDAADEAADADEAKMIAAGAMEASR